MGKNLIEQKEDIIDFATKKELQAVLNEGEDIHTDDDLPELMGEHERMKDEMFKGVITQGVNNRSEMPKTNAIYIRNESN